jgi:hypothetical protein
MNDFTTEVKTATVHLPCHIGGLGTEDATGGHFGSDRGAG